MKRLRIVGLTGQTGAGKSTVCKILENNGYVIIDADKVSHEITDTNKNCLCDLVMKFSCIILNADGTLNRKKLASIVFSDKKNLNTLNKTILPYIIDEINRRLEQYGSSSEFNIAVLDAPTLFESGFDKQCDAVVSVIADKETRLARIIKRDGLSEKEALERINAQNDEEFYTSSSNYIIKNDVDPASLVSQVISLFNEIKKELSPDPIN
ncbi:MAG: dephospho-CoA kinase [Oscillospiraceae bacterium]|nr:dephospho-CoA kinase [Oscillospiraceae bacterium]